MAVLSNRRKISAANYTSAREQEFYREADKLTADIKSLYDDYNTLYKQDSERGGGIDVYRPDSSAWYDNVSGLDSSLQAKADDILKRVEYYKSYLDPEYYKTLTSDIGNIKSNGSSILSNAQSAKDFYAQFPSEDSYNGWLTTYKDELKRKEEHQSLLDYDLASAKSEIDALKAQLDNITQGKPENFTPEAHALAKQYEEKVSYYNNAKEAQETLPFLTDSKYEAFEKGGIPLSPALIADAASKGYINKGSNDTVKYQFLTPEEKRIYQAYWINGEYQKANDYYNKLLPTVEKRIASGFTEMSEIPVFRSIASVGSNMLSGVEGLGNMVNYLSGQTNGLDKSVFAEGTSILRQGASEDLGKVGGFVYNAAMSGVDSITAGTLLGPIGGAIALGANAASSATNDALDRGMPEGKALQYGLIAGIFESVFENISLGNLDKLKQSAIPTWKEYGKEIAKQIGVNASEETFTEIGTIAYDSIVNGEFSAYAKLREEGKSPAEAIGSLGLDVLEAGASGALMGAGFGAVGGLKAKSNYNSFYDSVAGNIAGSGYTGDINLLVSALYKKQLADAGAGEIQSVNEREQSELDNYDKFVNNNRSRYELKGYLNTLKVGENGMTEAASIDIGDRDTSEVAKAFAARYKQGVNGSSIGGFDTAKYAVLSETEQKIAYNAGKMDAAQSLAKKTEGFRAEKQAKIDAENARIEAERQEAEAKKQRAIEAKEQATYKKMTPKMQENAEKYGLRKNGALAYAEDYTGDKSDASIGKYTEDFIKAYNAGKKGTDISRVGLGSLTDGQRRRAYNAGKADVEQNAPKFSSADIKATSGTTASSTVKQGSTKILADNSKAVANEISKIESPKMRQYAKDFKLGENGVKTYATVYNKSQNEGVYTQDFVAAYNVGKSGKDISEVKASSLTYVQKQQAYNAGKMDAIKATVDDKKSRTKTFANGSKVIVADQTKLTAEQKNITDTFAKAGIKVYLADIRTENGDSADGLYDHGTGIIYLSTDPRKALQFTAKHELTHFIEERVGKQQYFDLMNTIFDSETFKKWYEGKGFKSLTEMEANKVEEYRKGGIELNKDDKLGAKKEILADFVGEMLFGGKNQISDNLFSELDDNHKKTFREWMSALIDRLKTLFKGNKTAENEITKLEAKFKEMLKESLKSEAKGEGVSASYGGEKAETADRMRLDTAKQMISDGVSPEQVRKETGWFKGYDGKWRFEIDDSKMEYSRNGFNPDYLRYKELELKFLEGTISDQELQELKNIPQDIKNINLYRLDQFVKHKELFAAYPELRRLKITFDSNLKGNGAFYRNAFLIKINPQAKSVKNTLLHEIQHAIQFSEGFAGGADVTNDVELKNRLYVLKQEQKKISQELEAIYKEIGFDEYSESLWEKAWNMEIDPDTIESLEEQFLAEKSRKGLALYNYQKQVIEMVKEAMREESNLYEQYFNTAGEIEARDVSNRAALDAEQRKNTRPDIDREDVVFADSGNVYSEIKRDNKGNLYWHIETGKDIFNGIKDNKRLREAAYKFILENRDHSVVVEDIEGRKIEFIRLSAEEITNSKESQTLYKENAKMFSQKMRMVPSLDDLVKYSTVSWISPDHKNHKLYNEQGFINYRGKVRIDNVIFDYIVRVGQAKNFNAFHEINLEVAQYLPHARNANTSDIKRATSNDLSISQKNEVVNTSDKKTSTDSESSLSYTPADEQELTRMAQNGEISAEEYGRRMLEIKDSRHTADPYEIAKMNKEDLENPLPNVNRKDGEAKGDGQSKFAQSLQDTRLFDETFKKEVENDQFIQQYKTITNKETLAAAAKLLDEGGQDFVNTWFKKSAIRMSPVDTAVGFILLKRYQDIGNYNSGVAIAEKLRDIGTRTGQNLQVFSILNRFTPEMMQVYAQKQLDDAFEAMVNGKAQKWINKNKDKFKLTDEDIDFIKTRTLQAAMLPNNSREQAIRLAEINARLQDKIPPSFSTSWKTWQRMSMLFNPKTHLRNIAGNGIIAPAFVASDWFGTPVDILLSKFTGKRTTGLTGVMGHNKADLAEALKGASEAYDDFLRGINTKIEFDKFKIDSAGKGFNEHGKFGKMAKVLNNIDSLNSFLLTAEDALFYKMWFMNSLNNQKKLNNVSEATLEMIEIAQQEALQRTWQDNNVATKAVGAIKKVLNLDFTLKNKATGETYNPYQRFFRGYGFGDVFIKFVKTPANLTKAIYDFSPAGFASVAAKSVAFSRAVKKGTVSAKLQKDLVNSIGKAISGTLLYLMFGAMYSAGWITGKGDDDKDVAAFEKYVQGAPEYAIKIGKKWWSYDWAQPVGAIPAIISNNRETINEKSGPFQAVLEAISAGGDVLLEQSFMSSIQQMFSSTNFFGNLASAILDDITVPIPTLLSQTANVFDEKRRTTYDSQSSIRTAINKFKQKIPGLRNTLEVERDILGRETPNSQKSVVNAFFNPMNTFTDTSTAVTDHVYELYQSTGEASAIPSKAPYDVTIKGVKHTFSIEERNEYQRIMGETSAQIIGELLNNESYMALSDEQKLAVIKSVYSYSQSLAKSEMGLAESYDVISGIKDITEDEYNALSDAEIKAIADDYVLSSYYSISDFDNTKKATWFINKSLPSAINAAIKSGDMAKAQELIKSIEANIKSFGLPKKETNEMIKKSQSSIKSEITSYWKEKFIEAHKRGDNGEKIRIKQILVDTGLYGNSSDVRDLTNGWKKEK